MTQASDSTNQASTLSLLNDSESSSWWTEWVPTREQMENAARLRFDSPPDDASIVVPRDSVLYASMRQGMGMIVLTALIAGLLPFLWNWISAGQMGTTVPLAELQRVARTLPVFEDSGAGAVFIDAFRTAAGLPPAVFPGWMAAGISALGVWVNTPLHWLTWWIVYGLAVLVVAKMLGATTTLQQFYTLTSFSFLPLVFTGLGPIPCLGALIVLLALVWAVAIYVTSVRAVTGLTLGVSILATILPGVIIALLSFVVGVATAATAVGIAM
jgi:hypothetical protein